MLLDSVVRCRLSPGYQDIVGADRLAFAPIELSGGLKERSAAGLRLLSVDWPGISTPLRPVLPALGWRFSARSEDNETFKGGKRVTLIMRGAPVSAGLREEMTRLRERVPALQHVQPRLVTVEVGSDEAVRSYRSSIVRACERVGIAHDSLALDIETNEDHLRTELFQLNLDPSVSGVLVFMPIPNHLNKNVVLETLSPFKDVDGITPSSQGRLRLDLPGLRPSCPLGGIEILDYYGIQLNGADALVVGRSPVVGGPLASMLLHRNATVTIAHRHTGALASHSRRASLIALAAGSPMLLTNDMVSESAVVLDFGTNVVEGTLTGDADRAALEGYVAALSPVPGGTGPVTATVLARNVLFAAIANATGTLDDLPRAGTTLTTAAIAD